MVYFPGRAKLKNLQISVSWTLIKVLSVTAFKQTTTGSSSLQSHAISMNFLYFSNLVYFPNLFTSPEGSLPQLNGSLPQIHFPRIVPSADSSLLWMTLGKSTI